jgi:hypothetical protein
LHLATRPEAGPLGQVQPSKSAYKKWS